MPPFGRHERSTAGRLRRLSSFAASHWSPRNKSGRGKAKDPDLYRFGHKTESRPCFTFTPLPLLTCALPNPKRISNKKLLPLAMRGGSSGEENNQQLIASSEKLAVVELFAGLGS